MNDCLFCKIIAGEIPAYKVYENDHVFAFLDIHPATPYHTLVIPKQHSSDIFDTTEENLVEVMKVVKHLTSLYQDKLGMQNVQIRNSSGKDAQQDVFHLHFHIVPRSAGDGHDTHWKQHPELIEQFDDMLKKLED